MNGEEDGPQVSYSVRELIERLEKKLDQFLSLLSSKADRSDVSLIDERLDKHHERLQALEHLNNTRREVSEFRRWLVPTVFALILTLATIGSVLASTMLH